MGSEPNEEIMMEMEAALPASMDEEGHPIAAMMNTDYARADDNRASDFDDEVWGRRRAKSRAQDK